MAKQKIGVHGTEAETSPKPGTAEPQGAERAKRVCPITREQFHENIKPVEVIIKAPGGDKSIVLSPKEFSTGSLGLYQQEKVTLTIDGIPCQFQTAITLTLVGSKELPK